MVAKIRRIYKHALRPFWKDNTILQRIYVIFRQELYQVLHTIEDGTGDITCSGALPELCFPGLYVKNVGHISLPVQDEQAMKIKYFAKTTVCQDVKSQKIQDTHCWQLDAKQVTIKNDKFNEGVKDLFAVVKKSLGLSCSDENIDFRFEKMLLYGKGVNSKMECDVESDRDMFGVIEITLPSVFEGGKLTVRHAGKEKVVEIDGERSTYCCNYVAHYCDCEHEVSAITSGYRLALVYSLCWTASDDPPSADIAATVARKVAKLLPNVCNEKTIFFSWFLSCDYQESDLSEHGINTLIGSDATVATALVQANELLPKDEQYEFYIAEVRREVDEYLDCNNDVPSYRVGEHDIFVGSTFYNFDGTIKDIDFTEFYYYCDVVNYECPSDMSWSDFEMKFWGKGSCSDELPEKLNYSKDYERCNIYTRCAIFAWPKAHFVQILGRGDPDAAVDWVFDKFKTVEIMSSFNAEFQNAVKHLRQLLDLAINENSPKIASSIFTFLTSNLELNESVRIANVLINDVMARERYCSTFNWSEETRRYCLGDDGIVAPLVRLSVALGWSSVSECFTKMFRVSPLCQHSRWAEFLLKLVKETKNDEFSIQEDVCFKSIVSCLVEKLEADLHSNELESADIKMFQNETKNTRVNKIAVLLFHIGDQELIEKFTDAVCEYIHCNVNSCILQDLIETLTSLNLSENQFWMQLLKCRIEQLEEFVKTKVKPFSWEQEEAVIDGHPIVQAFLRGPTKTLKYDVFTSDYEARDFMFKFFKRPWPASDSDPRQYSVWVSIRGNGSKTYAVINKTREWYDRKVNKYNQHLEEVNKLKTLVSSAVSNISS